MCNQSKEASTDSTSNIRRRRTSSNKVRTGCVTCKIRHLKCDETKPSCMRCTKTGRTCDGYVCPPPKRKGAETSLSRPVQCQPLNGSPPELGALSYFYHNTAPKLASKYDTDFWNRLIYRMCYDEDSIKYAMIAVGAMDAQRSTQSRSLVNQTSVSGKAASVEFANRESSYLDDAFVILSYNKAVAAVAERIHDPNTPVQVILLACILFVYVELIRGNVELSLKHVRGGVSIANSMVIRNRKSRQLHVETMKQELHPIFDRLELLSLLLGDNPACQHAQMVMQTLPDKFGTLKEARDTVVQMMSLTYQFVQGMKLRKYNGFLLPDDRARKTMIQSQNDEWRIAFDGHIGSNDMTESEHDMARAIELHYLNCIIWVELCTFPNETRADSLIPQFKKMVKIAEETHNFACETSKPKPIFDMEIITPLYLSAVKCRHSLVRRRAIATLRKIARREGPWDSHMAAAIAERIMNVEEQDLAKLDGSELPTEESRVHTLHMRPLSCSAILVTFYTKPNGLNGPWGTWQEVVALEGETDQRKPRLNYFETMESLGQLLERAGVQSYGFDGHVLISTSDHTAQVTS